MSIDEILDSAEASVERMRGMATESRDIVKKMYEDGYKTDTLIFNKARVATRDKNVLKLIDELEKEIVPPKMQKV